MNPGDEYISQLEGIRKERVAMVINYIKEVYPEVEEVKDFSPKWHYPTYKKETKYVSVASMKNYVSVHFSNREGPQIVAKANTKIQAKVGCVNIKDTIEFPWSEIQEAIDITLK